MAPFLLHEVDSSLFAAWTRVMVTAHGQAMDKSATSAISE